MWRCKSRPPSGLGFTCCGKSKSMSEAGRHLDSPQDTVDSAYENRDLIIKLRSAGLERGSACTEFLEVHNTYCLQELQKDLEALTVSISTLLIDNQFRFTFSS